jgi:hypothetical protein
MIVVESPDLKRLAAGAAAYPKVLRASIRKELAAAALAAAKESRSKIRGMPVKGAVPYKESTGLRAAIGAATKAKTTVNSLGAGSKIYVARSAALAEHNRWRVAQLFDGAAQFGAYASGGGGSFMHPVYGTKTLVAQGGFPYFKTVIAERAPAIREAMQKTLLEAAKATLPNVR